MRWVLPVFLMLAVPSSAPLAQMPSWLETAIAREIPGQMSDDLLVILYEEAMVDVSRASSKTLYRQAVRLQSTAARDYFQLRAPQSVEQKFKFIGGWKVTPGGKVEPFSKKAIVQTDADMTYEFSQTKVNVFSPTSVRVGDVVAWEYTMVSPSEAYVEAWDFGMGSLPALLSRFGIKVPGDWEVRSEFLNHPGVEGSRDDRGFHVWELRNLEAAEREAYQPAGESVPRLLIAYGPGEGSSNKRQFDSWESVSRWYRRIVDEQVSSDRSLRTKAEALTAGAATPQEKIEAITRFTQGIRYLNVAIGRSVAEPHPAADILRNGFGDCEDKTVLTMALLREVGIESHPLITRTNRLGRLPEFFPGPTHFDHVVLGIKVPDDGPAAPALLEIEPFGRLVVFDPTDAETGFGDLAGWIQGAGAVIASESNGRVLQLPVLPPGSNSTRSLVELEFADEGGVEVSMQAEYTGLSAADLRSGGGNASDMGMRLRERLSGRFGDTEIREMEVSGLETPGAIVRQSTRLKMPVPGKDLGNIRILKASFLFETKAPRLDEVERVSPLFIESGFEEVEQTTVRLPEGWKLVSPPAPVKASSTLGDYLFEIREEGNDLVIERSLTIRAARIPASDYAQAQEFLMVVREGDNADIALEKSR